MKTSRCIFWPDNIHAIVGLADDPAPRVTELTATMAEAITKLSDAMSRKSPNPTVESDAREYSARGSP